MLALLAAASALVVAGVLGVGSRRQGPPLPSGSDGRIAVAVAVIANETGEMEMDALSGLLITPVSTGADPSRPAPRNSKHLGAVETPGPCTA